MKLAWATDVHLNFIHSSHVRQFGESIQADHLLITGDIAEGPSLETCLQILSEGFKGDISFVLGNHDYYFSSFKEVHEVARGVTCAKYLSDGPPVALTPHVGLVGTDGLYDCLAGSLRTQIRLNDFRRIQDLVEFTYFDRVDFMKEEARRRAGKAEALIREAVAQFATVIVATHVPPFPEVCNHQGVMSAPEFLPWYCNVTMGNLLSRLGEEFPDTEFLVLCGHTHSPGEIYVGENMRVLAGISEYYNPSVSAIFELV